MSASNTVASANANAAAQSGTGISPVFHATDVRKAESVAVGGDTRGVNGAGFLTGGTVPLSAAAAEPPLSPPSSLPSDDLPPFLRDTPDDLDQIAQRLLAGEIVALPTETVYGLAANALDPAAVRRIFAAKGRPLLDPLIVHALSPDDAARAAEIPPALDALAGRFWPGPLTVVLRKRACVPPLVTAGGETVAVRVPAHPLMRKVLARSGLLLAAPSANPFGYVSPTRAAHVRDSLGARAPWILDGGECRHGLESTILHLSRPDGLPVLLRPGPIPREALEDTLGQRVFLPCELADKESGAGVPPVSPPQQPTAKSSADFSRANGVHAVPAPAARNTGELPAPLPAAAAAPLPAPGMLTRHYSPLTPVILRPSGTPPALLASPQRQAIVWQRRPVAAAPSDVFPPDEYWFSEDGAPDEVARNIFALLRQLDAHGYAALHVELAPVSPLAPAINDRLRRAAAAPPTLP